MSGTLRASYSTSIRLNPPVVGVRNPTCNKTIDSYDTSTGAKAENHVTAAPNQAPSTITVHLEPLVADRTRLF